MGESEQGGRSSVGSSWSRGRGRTNHWCVALDALCGRRGSHAGSGRQSRAAQPASIASWCYRTTPVSLWPRSSGSSRASRRRSISCAASARQYCSLVSDEAALRPHGALPSSAEIAIRPFVAQLRSGSEAHPSLPERTNLDKISDTRSELPTSGRAPAGRVLLAPAKQHEATNAFGARGHTKGPRSRPSSRRRARTSPTPARRRSRRGTRRQRPGSARAERERARSARTPGRSTAITPHSEREPASAAPESRNVGSTSVAHSRTRQANSAKKIVTPPVAKLGMSLTAA